MTGQSGADSAYMVMPLSSLRSGQAGRIGSLLGSGESVRRLREMGLREGTEVRMVRPGRPCIVRLAGHKLCFRGEDGAGVLVRLELPRAC
jgi:ferrous iron transport protein A